MPKRLSTPRTVLPLAAADLPAAFVLTSPALVLRAELAVAVAALEVVVVVLAEAAVVVVVAAVVSVVAVAATSALSTVPSPPVPRSLSTKKVSSEIYLTHIEGCGLVRVPLGLAF
jgi:hypothetical protein